MRRLEWIVREGDPAPGLPRTLRSDRLKVDWAGSRCLLGLDGRIIAAWNPGAASVSATMPSSRRAAWLRVLRWLMARSDNELRGGATLHASAVSMGGTAVVFCGPSGVGKTTLVGFAGSRSRLCDEFCDIVREAKGKFHLARTGRSQASRPRTIPIAAILFPERGSEPRLVPLGRAEAATRILGTRYPGLWHERFPSKALEFSAALCRSVPVFAFSFPQNPAVMAWLKRNLRP